jgi:leucyl-tRNA synthetase
MEYPFTAIEEKWREFWREKKTFKTVSSSLKPKFYILDMFPYPSGAGLHVGHPLGYIASDIITRFKRLKGFNVLHPMGYDSFGLPAEQYAIQTGKHPAVTTEENIQRYRQQMDKVGFSFDWDRELRTSDPAYYKWTQWVFSKLFDSWYNLASEKAEKISELISIFENDGNSSAHAFCGEVRAFSSDEWKAMSEIEHQEILLNYRLAYLSESHVNWCPGLGTVLANEEVKDGVSERGGFPVEKKLMKQWALRITAYADRLLQGLEKIDWTDSLKDQQRNWIGKSEGASVFFKLDSHPDSLEVFTTRPDTLFGVSFMVIAPEHEMLHEITTEDRRDEVEAYAGWAANRAERDRMADVKNISGVFTGAYAIHPFSNEKIPVWVSDYVLAGYGTGAVMAVPAHDSRDFAFARHFDLPITKVIEPVHGASDEILCFDGKEGVLINSDFMNGLQVREAIRSAIDEIEKRGIGKGKTNFRLRDAVFSRQRYWGEPFPVYYKDGMPYLMDEKDLPLCLPDIDVYLPSESGEPPLSRATDWVSKNGYPLETGTMPGWAGSSWYYLRYMDPANENEFVSKEAVNYWKEIDMYFGGSEHATGHLLYFRFWTKFLFDLGYIPMDEPAKKLINQGMILGRSNFVYRDSSKNIFVSKGCEKEYLEKNSISLISHRVDVNIVDNDVLDVDAFRNKYPEFADAEFVLNDGKYICGAEVEKMSKSKFNVVNPDDIIEKYGADTLRLYEMFLGPIELSKPWNTNGIEGVFKFLRKFWRLFYKDEIFTLSDEKASASELKILHKTIKKIEEDIERFSFNTSVSNFMICVNELTDLHCNKREILEPLVILISPYAPHIAEELWSLMGYQESISYAAFPQWNESFMKEDHFDYPVSINGKTKFKISLPLSKTKEEIEKEVMASEEVKKWTGGRQPKKLIIVPGRIINIVIDTMEETNQNTETNHREVISVDNAVAEIAEAPETPGVGPVPFAAGAMRAETMLENIQQHIEALIFTSEQSIGAGEILDCLQTVYNVEVPKEDFENAIEDIKEKYSSDAYSFELVEIAEGYQFLTKQKYQTTLSILLQNRSKKRLSVAAMETLAIIAYKQPVTKSEIEHIRGVNSDYSVQKLLEKDLIEICGKSEGPGKPVIYATSKNFMDYFGIKSVKDLPQLKDIQATENEIGTSSAE